MFFLTKNPHDLGISHRGVRGWRQKSSHAYYLRYTDIMDLLLYIPVVFILGSDFEKFGHSSSPIKDNPGIQTSSVQLDVK